MRVVLALLLTLALLAGARLLLIDQRAAPLPVDLSGSVVFVSDRSGSDELYVKRLSDGVEQRLAVLFEPARDPAVSPDGRQVAFSMGGRIGLVSRATGASRLLTNGVDWRDAAPAWRADGHALVVVARRPGAAGDIHLLELPDSGEVARHALTETPGLDEASPVLGPDGSFVVFAREDSLFRLELADGRTRKLTAGFRRVRQPRFLPSGRLLCLWSQDKQYGIDLLDADGKNRETIHQGVVYYRSVVPSPDGRYLAATFTFDLSFRPLDALRPRKTEELRLLDARGNPVAVLARSWRHSNHSPDWGR